MTVDQFEQTLRELLRQDSFQPFVVEMVDGRVLTVDHPVVIGGGAASFLTQSDELVEFACEDVQAIREAVPGASP
jgi:hypothetical protein